MNDLRYDQVRQALLHKVPEMKQRIEAEFGENYGPDGDDVGAYPIFEDVVQPFVMHALQERENTPELRHLFELFEYFADSTHKDVRDLLGTAILEPLVYRSELLAQAELFMGPKTTVYANWEKERQRAAAGSQKAN